MYVVTMSSRLRIFLDISALISSDLAQIRIETALWRSRKHVVSWCSQSDIIIDNYYLRYERYIGHCLCMYSPVRDDSVLRPSFWIADWIDYDGIYNSYYQPRIYRTVLGFATGCPGVLWCFGLTHRCRDNYGRHLPEHIFKYIVLKENV